MQNRNRKAHQIVYFDTEGRSNLPEVIRVVKQKLKSREELRALKLIMLTREGEGPLLAYNHLSMYDPKIVVVTFPLSFSAKRPDKTQYRPQISERLLKFLKGVDVQIIVP